jgi:mycothiol synthase
MDVPTAYSVRRPRADEVDAVAAIFAAYDSTQSDTLATTAAEVAEDWARPRFRRDRDSWVVVAGGDRPVAYASSWDEEPHVDLVCDGVVHPDHWGRGLGGLLLVLMEDQARGHLTAAPAGAPVVLHNVIPRSDERAAELLVSRGYTRARTFLRMVLDLANSAHSPRLAAPGIEITTLRRGSDERPFYDTMVESFRGGWRSEPGPYEEWAQRMNLPDFDPGLWWLAWDGPRVVGALEARPVDDASGWVKNLGVRPSHRRRGIGAALLSHAFAEFKRRGCERVELGVDSANETQATAVYERIGMRAAQSFDIYAKHLTA